MAKGICPDCDRIVEISPDAVIKPGFSARYWKVLPHNVDAIGYSYADEAHIVVETLCLGSGKLI